MHLSSEDGTRRHLAARAVSRRGLQHATRGRRSTAGALRTPCAGLQHMAFVYCPGVGGGSVWQVRAVVRAVAIYGVRRCVFGWDAHFATHAERALWRAATVVLSALGLLPSSMFFAVQFTGFKKRRFGPAVAVLAYVAWPVMYILSSGYIIRQSIRQLFVLPEGAFRLPSFSSYLPHFS